MRRGPTFYRCGAGVNHYERPSTIAKWERADQERIAGQVAAKVRAHDDYMEAMRRFRANGMTTGGTFPDGTLPDAPSFEAGWQQAVMDMERALMDTMAARAAEETDDAGV